jgi:hypothetical protein
MIGGFEPLPAPPFPVECLCARGLGFDCRVYPVLELLELDELDVDADPGEWCKFWGDVDVVVVGEVVAVVGVVAILSVSCIVEGASGVDSTFFVSVSFSTFGFPPSSSLPAWSRGSSTSWGGRFSAGVSSLFTMRLFSLFFVTFHWKFR